jgi:general secretion pathway protein K
MMTHPSPESGPRAESRSARRLAAKAHRRARSERSKKRGVALVIVLAAISIMTVLLAELQDEASSEAAAAISDRDSLKAEYVARSAVNLARLLVSIEPTVRTVIGPIMMMLTGGSTQIPVWEFADQILGAFNGGDGTQAFSVLTGVDSSLGRNLGMKGARFDLQIIDEDSKINVNIAARGDAISQQRLGMALVGLMAGDQNNPLFEARDADGQFSDRQAICGAVVDWADTDENVYSCDPRNSQNTGGVVAEDTFYQLLKVPYRRKNAAYDSLDELHLVRGMSDDFFATFVDPEPTNPRKRVMTVWGQGAVNVNSANAQTLLSIVCGFAVQTPPQQLCIDPLVQAKFLTAVNLLRGFTAGAPLFSSPKGFVNAMKGKGPMGSILKDLLGLDPITFFSDAEVQKAVATESKVFSIYADGIVPGYRRTTKVRIHAVVDFRNAPPPGFGYAGIPQSAGSAGALPGSAPSGFAAPTPAPTGTAQGFSGTAGATATDAIQGALTPSPGGTIVYYRIE